MATLTPTSILRLFSLVFGLAWAPALATAQAPPRDPVIAPEHGTPAAKTTRPQKPPGDLPIRDGDPPIDQLPKDELKRRGWMFGDTSSLASSSTATLIALTGGLVVHGAGHLYSAEPKVGWALLGMEGVGLIAMSAAGVYAFVDGGAGSGMGVAAPVFQLGWNLFVNSFLLDVIGSIQGTEFEFEKNTLEQSGLSVDIGYGFIAANGAPARHVLRAGLEADLDYVNVSASTIQDVLLVTSDYIVDSQVRLFRIRPQTFAFLSFVGSAYNVADNAPFWRLSAEGRLGGSFDLGHFFRKFDQVAMGAWVGVGSQWYTFGNSLDLGSSDLGQLFISHESFMHYNLTKHVNLRMAYGSHPNSYVPSATRLLGTTDLGIQYQNDLGSFSVSTLLGDGVAIWIGARLTL